MCWLGCRLHQPLERRLSNGVLGDQPGGRGPVSTNLSLSGPAVCGRDRGEACGMCVVHRLHAWMVPAEQRAIGSEFCPDREIVLSHGQQLTAQFGPIHPTSIPSVSPERRGRSDATSGAGQLHPSSTLAKGHDPDMMEVMR